MDGSLALSRKELYEKGQKNTTRSKPADVMVHKAKTKKEKALHEWKVSSLKRDSNTLKIYENNA